MRINITLHWSILTLLRWTKIMKSFNIPVGYEWDWTLSQLQFPDFWYWYRNLIFNSLNRRGLSFPMPTKGETGNFARWWKSRDENFNHGVIQGGMVSFVGFYVKKIHINWISFWIRLSPTVWWCDSDNSCKMESAIIWLTSMYLFLASVAVQGRTGLADEF